MKTTFCSGLLIFASLFGISLDFGSDRNQQKGETQNSEETDEQESIERPISKQLIEASKDKSDSAKKRLGAEALDKQIVLSVKRLLEMQAEDGAWPYEGVYRVRDNGGRRRIPVGYRIGGTSIVCTSLLYAVESPSKKLGSQIETAVRRGTEVILNDLENLLMEPSAEDTYDVRVWGHIFALDYFCRLQNLKAHQGLAEKTKAWIPKLTNALVKEEINGGGWNYSNQQEHACFVTTSAVQALLLARSVGMKVDDAVFARSANVLIETRCKNGAYHYSGTGKNRGRAAKLPGSIARSAGCETSLALLGNEDQDHLGSAIIAFFEHWDELEKRRQKDGTHEGPYGVAPYYFYFGHRYVAQSITLLPEEKQAAEFERFNRVLLKTLDDDNTWNDRIFKKSKAYGTAMALLALRTKSVPLPMKLKPASKKAVE